MVVFISDIHLSDHQPGKDSVNPGAHFSLPEAAFRGTFEDIAVHARRDLQSRLDAKIPIEQLEREQHEINIVILGDFFDLIHTEHWARQAADAPQNGQDGLPWWDLENPDPDEASALKALEEVVAQDANKAIFALMSDLADPQKGGAITQFKLDPLKLPPGADPAHSLDIPFRFTYVPGNHDRLCNKYASLRRLVAETLPLGREPKDMDQPFSWHYCDCEHRVYGAHGNRVDDWNFEPGVDDQVPGTPIGDPITAMLVSRLPLAIKRELESALGVEEDQSPEANAIYESLLGVFDVRPFSAIIPWLFIRAEAHTQRSPEVREAINRGAKKCAGEFFRIPLVRQWLRSHFTKGLWLRAGWGLVKTFGLLSILKEGKLIDWVSGHLHGKSDADYIEAARDLSDRLDIDTVVFGHTHTPLDEAVAVSGDRERIYLNTGTWRPRFEKAHCGGGFVAMKGLTYVIAYRPWPGEKTRCNVETWTGMLKDHDVRRVPAGPDAVSGLGT